MPSAKRSLTRSAATAPAASVTGSPSPVLDQRVAALQGALGFVGAQGDLGPVQRRPAALHFGAGGAAARPLEHDRGEAALEAEPLGDAAFGGGADLPRLLVEGEPLAPQRPGRAARQGDQVRRAGAHGALGRTARARRRCARGRARATPQSSGTAASAAWVGVEQATAATSSIRVESRSWPTALTTGTRSIATVRQSVSSQKAQRSARLPPPRVTTIASTCGCAARSWIAAVIAGAAWRSCTGAKAQTTVPAQPRRSQAGQQVAPGRAGLGGDDADRLRQHRPPQLPLQLEEPLGLELLAQRLEPSQQVPLAGQAHVRGAKGEAGRGLATAGVVVGPTGDHDFGAIAKRTVRQPRLLEIVEPDRAGNRPLAVAQLEVGLHLAAPDAGDLADQQHPGPPPHLLLQLAGVAPDRETVLASPAQLQAIQRA